MEKLNYLKRFQFYFWVGLVYFILLSLGEIVQHPEESYYRVVNTAWRTIFILFINILFFEYTTPHLNRRKFLVFIVMFFFELFLFSYGLYVWRQLGIHLNIHTPLKKYPSSSHAISEQMGISVFSLFFFGIIKHISGYIKLKKSARQLKIEKQEAELNYLKSQTNPHFLFNTLNNIYSLSRMKSDLAPESIMRLSKILRFMLYETSGPFIAIEQEVKIISDYIALEQLRYDESLRINFNHDIEDMKQSLPPLLLMPLVENAFKHGVSETRGLPYIDIHLSVNKRQLAFNVTNSSEKNTEAEVKENIGLSNLRRQLELQFKEYDLLVKQEQASFIAILKINLASHV